MDQLHEILIALGHACKACTLLTAPNELEDNRGLCKFCRMADDDRNFEAGRDE